MFLLDTNILAEARKKSNGTINSGVEKFLKNTPYAQTFISVMTLMEIKQGIFTLQHRNDSKQASILNDWLENEMIPTFKGRILPIDVEVALTCASFHVPNKAGANDALIGATAKAHNLTVVTRNDKDFAFDGVKVINPFD